MVKKILAFINKDFEKINQAAFLLGILTLFSQFLGLIRDRLLASNIGAGEILDTYYAAFRIPDFLYVSVASLISVTVLLPILIEKMGKENDKEKGKIFVNEIFTIFVLFMVFTSILVYILMPKLAHLIAPGFDQENLDNLVKISRIMLLSPIFIGISNVFGVITQAYKKFFIFSLSSIFYNIGIIVGILIFYPVFGIYGLSFGVILGAFLHLLVQVPVLSKINFLPKFSFKFNFKEIFNVIKISLPRTLALASSNLSFMFIIAIASTVGVGAISLFTFSYNLQSVPVGIIGISFSVASFPILVKSFSNKDLDSFRQNIINSIKQIIFWSLPATVLFIVLRAQIVRVILGVENFSWSDTKLTTATLAIFVLSLVSQSLVFLFVRGYYAGGNTKKPLIINIFSAFIVVSSSLILLNIFKNYPNILNLLEHLLRIENIKNTAMLALPIGYTIGSIVNVFLLWVNFRKDFLKNIKTNIMYTFWQSMTGAFVIGLSTYLLLDVFDEIFSLNTFWGILGQGFFAGIISISIGCMYLYFIKNQEFLNVLKVFKNKFWKNKILTQEQRGL